MHFGDQYLVVLFSVPNFFLGSIKTKLKCVHEISYTTVPFPERNREALIVMGETFLPVWYLGRTI